MSEHPRRVFPSRFLVFSRRATDLDDDTFVTGGMNRLDTRMIIVQHVAYKPHRAPERSTPRRRPDGRALNQTLTNRRLTRPTPQVNLEGEHVTPTKPTDSFVKVSADTRLLSRRS